MNEGNIKIADVAALGILKDVQTLIEAGYNLNEPDAHGDYPITIAARRNDTKMLRLLADSGADCTVVGGDGRTALAWATFYQNIEMQQIIQSKISNRKTANKA